MRFLFVIFSLFLSLQGFCQEPNFITATEAYKQQDFKKAKEIFSQLVEQSPNNPTLLLNLGLSEYNLGNSGMALGLWRKARYLDSGSKPISQAIEFAEEQLFPDENSTSFISSVYNWLLNLPHLLWYISTLVLFFLATWFSIEYGVKQKKPPLDWPPWIFAAFPVFLFTLSFSVNIIIQTNQLRATVIAKEVQTHTTPSGTSPTLSQLQEGQEVIVVKSFGEWVQIKTSTGNPGWVLQNNLIAFRR